MPERFRMCLNLTEKRGISGVIWRLFGDLSLQGMKESFTPFPEFDDVHKTDTTSPQLAADDRNTAHLT